MKNILIASLLIIISFGLMACGRAGIDTESENISGSKSTNNQGSNTTPEDMPEDFEFVNSWRLKKYDSESQLFMWAGIPEDYYDEFAVKIILTEEDKEEIWRLIQDLQLETYLEEYNENIEDIIPPIGARLEASCGGKEYSVKIYHVTNSSNHSQKRKKLYDTMEEIIAIVESYPEAKEIGENYPFPLE